MCGITAYCGNGEALPFLMQGLAKLEYSANLGCIFRQIHD